MLFFHNYLKISILLTLTNLNLLSFIKPVFSIEINKNFDIRHRNDSLYVAAGKKGLSFKGKKGGGLQRAGDARPNCPLPSLDGKGRLVALMPTSYVGTTTQENPTLWFYVPYSPKQIEYGNFVLQDTKGENEQRIKFTLPNTPGFVSLKIPKGLELKVGTEKQWFFELYCKTNKSPASVHGNIERIEVNSDLRRLLNVPEEQKYKVYAENGIWFDTLNSLANLRQNQPMNKLNDFWQELLSSQDIGLSNLPSAPLVGEVSIQNP